MGQTLYLLRHAKAAVGDARISDAERPLAPEGVAAARRMGTSMREKGFIHDYVYCSPARRTQQTWLELAPHIGGGLTPHADKKLYLASAGTLMTLLQGLPASCAAPLLIGHNPGLQLLAALLCGQGDQEALDALAMKYPTTGLAVISFDLAGWKELAPGLGRLDAFLWPRRP